MGTSTQVELDEDVQGAGPVVVAALELGGLEFQNDTLRAMLVSKRTPFLRNFLILEGREFLQPEI